MTLPIPVATCNDKKLALSSGFRALAGVIDTATVTCAADSASVAIVTFDFTVTAGSAYATGMALSGMLKIPAGANALLAAITAANNGTQLIGPLSGSGGLVAIGPTSPTAVVTPVPRPSGPSPTYNYTSGRGAFDVLGDLWDTKLSTNNSLGGFVGKIKTLSNWNYSVEVDLHIAHPYPAAPTAIYFSTGSSKTGTLVASSVVGGLGYVKATLTDAAILYGTYYYEDRTVLDISPSVRLVVE
eukprot:tig00021619_g22954.t1